MPHSTDIRKKKKEGRNVLSSQHVLINHVKIDAKANGYKGSVM